MAKRRESGGFKETRSTDDPFEVDKDVDSVITALGMDPETVDRRKRQKGIEESDRDFQNAVDDLNSVAPAGVTATADGLVSSMGGSELAAQARRSSARRERGEVKSVLDEINEKMDLLYKEEFRLKEKKDGLIAELDSLGLVLFGKKRTQKKDLKRELDIIKRKLEELNYKLDLLRDKQDNAASALGEAQRLSM